jgi:HD-GYP domain-containing protein (c-di-GMP phosphodiesterase class II)
MGVVRVRLSEGRQWLIDRSGAEIEASGRAVIATLLTFPGLQPGRAGADRPGMDAQLDLLHAAAANDQAGGPPSGFGLAHGAPVPGAANGPRLGELLGSLSHALDMTEGQPAGHCMRSCWIGQQIGRAIGLNTAEMRELYYATLLKDSGCSSNAARLCELFLTDDLSFKHDRKTVGLGLPSLMNFVIRHTGVKAGLAERLRAVVNAVQNGSEIHRELTETRCSRGAQIARQLRFGEDVADGIQGLDEHWDGSGQPQGLSGKEIPLYSRIALLAQVVDVFHAGAGPQATREEVARRSGRWFDPRIADTFAVLARDPEFWRQLASDDLELRVLEMEPAQQPQPVDDDYLDDIATAFGQIVDAKSPYTAGHSSRVASIADQLCGQLGLGAPERRWLRRGALLHDVGKLGVSNQILDKPGRLDPLEWAAVQHHALHTEQILGRISAFGVLARVAGAHHEKLDGTGYPRGLDARHIRLETRIITTADIFDALTADRPYRPAMPTAQALQVMRDSIGTSIDGDCFAALERSLAALGEFSAFGAL